MRFIDAAEIRRVLSFPMLVDALEAAHLRAKIEIADQFMGSEGAQYLVRSAVDPSRLMASKLITSFPGNLGGALPAVHAVCAVFDGTDGRPLAALDGTEITYWKTAADSALGARFLARKDATTLLVVGAGAIAPWLVRAHRAVRPALRRVLVWNRTAARAELLAAALRAEGVTAEVAANLDAAVSEADVITSCTRSHDPLIKGALLKPGAHVDLVGGYTPETREADDDAVLRARVFVDRRETAFEGVGDISQPIERGVVDASHVLGDLYDLTQGRVSARTSTHELTLFKNAGGAHLDLMTAETVLRQAGVL